MYIAIDTSTNYAGLAVVKDGCLIAELNWHCHRNHSVELMPRLEQLLKQTGLELQAAKGIIVAIGPGSFNGLRVGVSTAKGLAFSLNVPVIGINTLEAAAWQHAAAGLPICPVFNAGRNEFAAAIYQLKDGQWQTIIDSHITSAEDLCLKIKVKTIFCGEADESVFRQIKDNLGQKAVIPSAMGRLQRAAFLAELGIGKLEAGEYDNPASLQPVYLRKPPITKPKRNISINNNKR